MIFRGKVSIRGLNSGKIIEKLIDKVAKEKGVVQLKDLSLPLFIPSIDTKTGSIIIFTSSAFRGAQSFSDQEILIEDAPLAKAVHASCSFPGIFSPVNFQNYTLLDGGIRENTPWKILKQMGADEIVNIVFKNHLSEHCCDNIVDLVHTSIEILCHELSTYELLGATNIILINTPNISLLDCSKINYLYKIGYQQATKLIQKEKFFKASFM